MVMLQSIVLKCIPLHKVNSQALGSKCLFGQNVRERIGWLYTTHFVAMNNHKLFWEDINLVRNLTETKIICSLLVWIPSFP